MKKMLVIFSVILGMSLAARAVTKTEVIANTTQNIILKTYQDMVKTSYDLKKAVDVLVTTPTQKNLEAAQQAWRAVRAAYEVSEGFLFGPMDALGIDPMIDTWPLNLKDVRVILASNQTLDVDFIRSLGTDVQGFHVIEFFLFGEGIVSNTKDISLMTPRQMDYLLAATALLVEQTDLLMFAWTHNFDPEDASTPAYIDVIGKPGPANPYYSTESAVIQELVNGMIHIVAEAGDGKLPDATGSDIENANASLEESPFSWNSINDFTSNINSVLNIYTGSYNGHSGASIKDLVATVDSSLADRVEAQMLFCRTRIQEIAGPTNMSFGQAIKDPAGRTRIFAAIQSLIDLHKMLENEVAPVTAQ